MKKNLVLLISIIVIGIIGIVTFIYTNNIFGGEKNSSKVSELESGISSNDYQEIDWSKIKEEDITLSESINITKEGIYNLTGKIDDGLITIDTTGNVRLVLNNVSITNTKGPAIYIKNAKNISIYLAENSINTLVDGNTYVGEYVSLDGTIYSADDLILEGSGTLNIKANNQDAVVSKDTLWIKEGNYKIDANDDGIRGKDSVYIENGNIEINALGNGIKTTNKNDNTKGYILIDNGNININATLDGIDAETKIIINNGNFDICTGGGSVNSSKKDTWGIWGRNDQEERTSAKGIKAKDNIIIKNGTFKFDTSDDALHTNNSLGIENGNINIKSGDDALHADKEIVIDKGNINIEESYEGIEANNITINDGIINLKASDDGININGGNDESGMHRRGENNFSTNSDNNLVINGGEITVDAKGDGIDTNGSAYIYGGNIVVYGPEDDGNGIIDYNVEFVVNGGSFIGIGTDGMIQNISDKSTQYNVTIVLDNRLSGNHNISIIDSNNKEIIKSNTTKLFSAIIVSSPELKQNDNYKLIIDDEETQNFTIENITTEVGNVKEHMGGPMDRRR